MKTAREQEVKIQSTDSLDKLSCLNKLSRVSVAAFRRICLYLLMTKNEFCPELFKTASGAMFFFIFHAFNCKFVFIGPGNNGGYSSVLGWGGGTRSTDKRSWSVVTNSLAMQLESRGENGAMQGH